MKTRIRNVLLYCVTWGSLLLLPAAGAAAAELGDFCWQTEAKTTLRFSLSQSGTNHYTYTGLFNDGDGASFAIMGEVSSAGDPIVGSFSGSKSTDSQFKTGIWQVSLSPASPALDGSAEGIVQVYDRASATVTTVHRTHTLTRTQCP